MDLLGAACAGAPKFPSKTRGRIGERQFTAAVSSLIRYKLSFALLYERKEIILLLNHPDRTAWWEWCLGISGRFDSKFLELDSENLSKYPMFWRGFVYSAPDVDLPEGATESLSEALMFIVNMDQAKKHLLYDPNIRGVNHSEVSSEFVRGVRLEEFVGRPYEWLTQIDLRPLWMKMRPWEGPNIEKIAEEFSGYSFYYIVNSPYLWGDDDATYPLIYKTVLVQKALARGFIIEPVECVKFCDRVY